MRAEARRELEETLGKRDPDRQKRRLELLHLSAACFWLLDIPSLRRSAGEALELAVQVGRGAWRCRRAAGWCGGL